MIRRLNQWRHKRKLARITKANRESFELERYRRNRAAQIKRRVG